MRHTTHKPPALAALRLCARNSPSYLRLSEKSAVNPDPFTAEHTDYADTETQTISAYLETLALAVGRLETNG